MGSLSKELKRIEAFLAGRAGQAIVPADRVEFAKMCGIEPDDWQADLLRSDHPQILLNCSRQSGKSTTVACLSLHEALYYPDSLILVLSPALRQSQELFDKLHTFYTTLGQPLRAYSERKLSLELTNGSRIEALPGSERTIRGFSGVSLLCVDEAARIEDSLYYSIRPMLAVSGGRLIMLSTPYGKRGVFYEVWEDGGEAWQRFEVPASACPRISEEFLESERKSMPHIWYLQEYHCAFLETDEQFYSEATIRKLFDVSDADDVPILLWD